MRNALGLMVASVIAAVVIAGGWFFYSSRAEQTAPGMFLSFMKTPAELPRRD